VTLLWTLELFAAVGSAPGNAGAGGVSKGGTGGANATSAGGAGDASVGWEQCPPFIGCARSRGAWS
jgi:hypothetical protein